ncbi:MAG: hypothetical protein ACRCXZ_06695, partial [Patescibacteria group bacterium]
NIPAKAPEFIKSSVARAETIFDSPEKIDGAVNASSDFIARLDSDFQKLKTANSLEDKAVRVQSMLNILKDAILPSFGVLGTILGFTQQQIDLYGYRVTATVGFVIALVSVLSIIYITVQKTLKQAKEKQK